MNDATSPGGTTPARAQGRGLRILLTVRPPITKKDISGVRRRLASTLSHAYASVELSYYERDKSSTFLKIQVEQATFQLNPAEVKDYYFRLMGGFLVHFAQELRSMNYIILDIQVEFLARTRPPEREGEFVPLPTAGETSGLNALLAAINRGLLSTSPVAGSGEGNPSPPEPSSPADPGEENPAVPSWIERELRDPEELSLRQKALQASEEQRVEEGIQICLAGLEKYPDSPYLLYLLGTLVSSQGKDADARVIFDHLIQAHPKYAEAYRERGRIRGRLQDMVGSEQDLAKARELDPSLFMEE